MGKKFIFLAVLIVSIPLSGCMGQSSTKKDLKNEANKENTMKTIQLTKAEFLTKIMNYEENPKEWKYLGDKPAIIDFYATWCGPCKSLSPTLEVLAEEYDGKIYIYKVDIDKERELTSAFGVQSVPTLVFVPMIGEPQMAQGALPKAELKKVIDGTLLK